jgi:O-antigen/teichoic acid export membrane protein
MNLKLRLDSFAALVDQVWLSLLNVAIALVFIRYGSKDEYATFVLLTAPLLLIQSVQNALVNSPLATLFPRAHPNDQPAIGAAAVSLSIYLGLIAAAAGGAGLALYFQLARGEANTLLVVAFSSAILGALARESRRSSAYVRGKGLEALKGDLIYGVLLIGSAVLCVTIWNGLTAPTALALIGAGGLIALSLDRRFKPSMKIRRPALQQFWTCGRWALPSVVVTWLNLSAYPFFAERALGLAAVADIAAARMLVSPIGLFATAWSNWYRPKIARWLADDNVALIKIVTYRSALLAWVLLVLLTFGVWLAYDLIEVVLGEKYRSLFWLLLTWVLFFGISLARNFFMATLMTDAEGYKFLHHVSWAGLLLGLPGFISLSGRGSIWIVGTLCAVEVTQTIAVVVRARAYWVRRCATVADDR